MSETIFIGGGGPDYGVPQSMILRYANRHGLVAGATGTGKTVTLQIMAENFSAKGVPVFALTNFGIQTFEIAEPVYPFLTEFDRRYISGHMSVIKPDALIYQMVEADCGIAPQALLFADDRIDNIRAAEARGWQTHLFDYPQGWADRLVAEGLLTRGEAECILD